MNEMMRKLFPAQVDQSYGGHPIAKWAFLFLTIVTIARSLVHMFAPDGGAQSIATIPLDTLTVNGANSVILIFAFWGLSQFMMGLLYGIVLWRYQSLIPLMYVFTIFEYGMRMVLGAMKPIETVSTAPGEIGNYVILPLAVILLFLSLWGKERP